MQVVVNLASNTIVNTDFLPEFGDSTRANGHYVIPMPSGVGVDIDSGSYILPQNPGSVPGQLAANMLIRYPMYDHVIFEYYLESSDVAGLDLTFGAPLPTSANVTPAAPWDPAFNAPGIARCQVGRGLAAPAGVAPNCVAMLPAADTDPLGGPPFYGAILTLATDITAVTNPLNPGTDEVMIWWELARATNSEDVVQGYGATAGLNTPSIKSLERIDPETAGIYVYASVDDGVTWFQAQYLEPTDLVVSGVLLRLAFINTTSDKVFLIGNMVLFPDLP